MRTHSIQTAKLSPLILILGFSPWGWGSPHHFHKEQKKYPLKVGCQCWYGHTAMGWVFANPHWEKQPDWSEQDSLSYPWTFLLASGVNYFYVLVSVCSLLSAFISSTAGSGLCFLGASTTPPWHGIKRGSLGVNLTWSAAGLFIYITFSNDVAFISCRSQACPSSALIAGGPYAHNTSWLPSGALLCDFSLGPPGRKPLWAHWWWTGITAKAQSLMPGKKPLQHTLM